jgi:hypothetical protein
MPHRTTRKPAKQEWKWVQPRIARREYELRAGGKRLAVLRDVKMFGSLAEADTGDGRWTLKRQGFLRPRVTVRRAGSEDEFATLVFNWLGDGALHMADGRVFGWKCRFWSRQYCLTTEQGEELVEFKPTFAFVKGGAKVTIHPSAADISGLSLLAVIGWYVMLLGFDEAASCG